MFPTPTFVPSKECSGVRFVTSPAENKNKKGSMQLDCEPQGPLWVFKQRNPDAIAALRTLNYHADVFRVMLESMFTYFCRADSSSFRVCNSSGVMHQIISPKYTCLRQLVITERSDFLTLQRAITEVISQIPPCEENILGTFLLEDAMQTDIVTLSSQLKAAFIR